MKREARARKPWLHRFDNARARAIRHGGSPLEITAEAVDIRAYYEHVFSQLQIACHWCDAVVSTERIQIDHVIPLSRGGKHSLGNLCASCVECNELKRDKTPDEFLGTRGERAA